MKALWWRFFLGCFHILYGLLKIRAHDVKPWKQLDAAGFMNYFCQGLDFGDLTFFPSSFKLFFSPSETCNKLNLLKLLLEATD